jgi:two-component system, LytTR family, sensor kinase
MSRTKLYWKCQIAGWCAWNLCEFILYGEAFEYDSNLVVNALINIFLGILLTHNYRRAVKQLNWLYLSLNKLIPRIVVSVGLLTFILTILNIFVDYYTVPETRDYMQLSRFFLTFVNLIQPLLVWTLIYHMFHYFELSKKNELEKVRLSSSIRDFEAKLLRSQLNPHFVFNALNSIRALVLENPEKAQLSVTRLSNILRNSLLADRRKTVTLAEELKTVQDYLALEKIRYEDRLEERINIPAEAMQVQVPPMMVQTLVENAVKHGISKPIHGGFIALDAEIYQNSLYLYIRNTGSLQPHKPAPGEGFGLVNTQQRLDLIFGNQASFEISQESDNVVCARLILPLHTTPDVTKTPEPRKKKTQVI